MNSKTLILSPLTENKNSRGILTLYTDDDLLKCRIRLYSTPELSVFCKLGIYHQQEVYTANLLYKNGQYESSFVGDFDMSKDFYCAIINTEENNSVILAGGTYAGYYFNDTSVFNKELKKEEPQTLEENNTSSNCEDCSKCANCKYKEFFYSHNTSIQVEPTPEETPSTIHQTEIEAKHEYSEEQTNNSQNTTYPTILDSITPQFKYVFQQYPADETLNNLVENGKFVTINENGEQYSIGAIYNEDEIKYIAYAIKSNYNTTPPQEIGEHYQWLPLDSEDPLSEGYYLVFQDATDLKILEL